jgi:uncharacterized repeat protein (TIGR01451 family)
MNLSYNLNIILKRFLIFKEKYMNESLHRGRGKIYKLINVFSMSVLILNMSFLGVFFVGTDEVSADNCCIDNDGDGYCANCEPVDCDDSNPEVNPGATEICDNQIDDDCDEDVDCDDSDCIEDPACVESITIKAYKIVCESEKDLPNWGTPPGLPDESYFTNYTGYINPSTIADFLTNRQGRCQLVPDWHFQWSNTGESNPGDNTGEDTSGNWYTVGPTDGNGEVTFTVDSTSQVRVREVWSDTYLPFVGNGDESDISAEIYCYDDVYHYDNFDFINSPAFDETYYCVAFNVPEPRLEVCKYDTEQNPLSGWEMTVKSTNNLVLNGGFEYPVVDHPDRDWDVFPPVEVDWGISWVDPEEGAPDPALLELHNNINTPAEGDQYAELDTDYDYGNKEKASVSIYQDISTDVGKQYELKFSFSPRPGIADNQLRVQFGSLDTTISADGTGLSDTNWTEYTYVITADANPTELRFTDLSFPDSYGTFLDDVQVYEYVTSGVTGEDGCVSFYDLVSGEYIVSEIVQPDWVPIDPDSGMQLIEYEEGYYQKISFINFYEGPPQPEIGSLTICKYYDYGEIGQYENATDTPLWWEMTVVDQDGPDAGETWYTATNGDTGCIILEDMDFGEYKITEETRVGWVNSYPGTTTTQEAVISGGDPNPMVIFLNYEGSITVCKYEDKDGDGMMDYPEISNASTWDKIWSSIIKVAHAMMPSYPLGGWIINVTGQTPQTTDAEDGCTTFTVPYGTYTVSEDSQPNWTQTYPTDCGGPINHSVTIDSEHTYEMVYFLNHYIPPCETESTGSSGSYYTYSDQGSSGTTPPPSETPPTAVLGEEGAPSLTISKFNGQVYVNPGDTDIAYSVTITNNGNLTAFSVTLVDTLPSGLSFSDVSGDTRTWELGDIAPGETKESNYFVNVDEGAEAMVYTNTVVASASNHDPVSAQANLEVRGVEVLAETGFSLGEFLTLLAVLFGLTGVSLFLRKRLA